MLLCDRSVTHGNNSTDLADPDKALEPAQIFELFVQKCSVRSTFFYHIKLLLRTVVRLCCAAKPPTVFREKVDVRKLRNHAGVCGSVCVRYDFSFFFSE